MENQVGKRVIVRADKAGVFYGTLSQKNGLEVQLTNARKLYYWSGANTVEQLAKDGVKKPEECKFTDYNEESTISNYVQIITCTEKSIQSIEGVQLWKQ